MIFFFDDYISKYDVLFTLLSLFFLHSDINYYNKFHQDLDIIDQVRINQSKISLYTLLYTLL